MNGGAPSNSPSEASPPDTPARDAQSNDPSENDSASEDAERIDALRKRALAKRARARALRKDAAIKRAKAKALQSRAREQDEVRAEFSFDTGGAPRELQARIAEEFSGDEFGSVELSADASRPASEAPSDQSRSAAMDEPDPKSKAEPTGAPETSGPTAEVEIESASASSGPFDRVRMAIKGAGARFRPGVRVSGEGRLIGDLEPTGTDSAPAADDRVSGPAPDANPAERSDETADVPRQTTPERLANHLMAEAASAPASSPLASSPIEEPAPHESAPENPASTLDVFDEGAVEHEDPGENDHSEEHYSEDGTFSRFLKKRFHFPDHFWPKSWKRSWARRAASKAGPEGA